MQQNGARRFSSQTKAAFFRWMSSHSVLSPAPSFRQDIRDHQVLCEALRVCKLTSDLDTAVKTHTRIIKVGYENYPFVVASLVSTYVHCGRPNFAGQLLDQVFCWAADLVFLNLFVEKLMRLGECDVAKRIFSQMPAPDVVTWNSMIGGYVRNSRFEDALRFFRKMLRSNVEPDKFTFASIISGCARLGALNYAVWLHGLMKEKNIELNFILSSALIDMYAKCGKIQTAREVFDSVQPHDVSIWNAMINGLAVHGLASDAFTLFSKMEVENILPDSITFIGILTACSHCGLVEEGRKYFDLMSSCYSIQPRLEHYGTMVDLLSRAGLLEEAYALIEAMPMEPDVVIWRAFLSACRTYRKPDQGEVAFANISRLKSGDFVLLSNTYCSLKRWGSAETVREIMKKKGVRKKGGKSWVEFAGAIHQFKAGDKSHPETEAIYKLLERLVQWTKLAGFMPTMELVLMDVSEEEKEENLNHHSEKLALAYGFLKTVPGAEIRISKNLRICYDCHKWIKIVSRLQSRVIIVRDRIRFHRFESGFCSCGDYW